MGVILKDVELTDASRFKQFVSQSRSRMEVSFDCLSGPFHRDFVIPMLFFLSYLCFV